MSAVEERRRSGDPLKRATFRFQWWLVAWRRAGGNSSHEAARYVRLRCAVARHASRRLGP